MKKRFSFLSLVCITSYVFFLVFPLSLYAGLQNIDGISSHKWKDSQVTFDTDQDFAQGFVKFADGIFIHRNVGVTLDITESINGQINLDDFGKIILNGPLYLASDATLANGGIIEGRGHTITLDNDLTLTAGKQLHITSTLSIDGRGNTLYLEPHACLVVDHGVTLTLKNIRVKNMRNNLANPIIRPTGYRAHVALQNVELALADDFIFREGQLFIHDEVIVTGTSVFSYRSTQTSYICDASTLGFDKNTTFFYYPSTIDNSLVQMQSETSTLYLDGATLLTTHTGMRLSKGVLCFDNNVTLSSASDTDLTSLTGVRGKGTWNVGVRAVAWSPDGKYLAVGTGANPDGGEDDSDSGLELRVYRFDLVPTPTLISVVSKDEGSSSVLALAWRPDGKYLAVGTSANPNPGDPNIGSGHEIQVYRFDTISTPQLVGVVSEDEGGVNVNSLSWSPDGNYLAVGTAAGPNPGDPGIDAGHELQVYKFDVTSVPTLTGCASKDEGGDGVYQVAWRQDGKYLAVGTSPEPAVGDPQSIVDTKEELQVFGFDTTSTPTLFGVSTKSLGAHHAYTVAWSPDGQYLGVGTNLNAVPEDLPGDPEFMIYRFDETTLTGVASLDGVVGIDVPQRVMKAKWSPDGKYILLARDNFNNGRITLLSFDGTSLVSAFEINLQTTVSPYPYPQDISWIADGKYVAVGMGVGPIPAADNIAPDRELRIYEVGYRFDTTDQTFSNGIIFGDSKIGSVGELDVHVLAGAQVEIDGYVTACN